jgi:hypothetical protein
MKRVWIRESWYGRRAARKLLDYLTRRKTTTAAPRWDAFGDVSEKYLLARTRSKTRPIKNRLFEVTTYIETLDELSKVWGYLEERLARPVVCYCHFDESADHVHFVCRSADDQGRALRVGRMDLAEINARVTSLLGRQLSPRGTGREQLSLGELRAYPQGLAVCKTTFRETITAVDKVMALYAGYSRIRIATRSSGAVRIIQEIDPARSARDQLFYRHLKKLASTGSEILFSPVGSQKATLKPLYLNKVPARHLDQLPAGTVVVEASGSYRVHIPVITTLTSSRVATAQRVLCAKLDTDRESVPPGQWRHLPGFHDVRIRDDMSCYGVAVSILALMDELKEQRRVQAAAAARTKHIRTERTWHRFWQPNRDKADLDYAEYLLGQGCSPKDTRARIIAESEDIVLRRGIHMSRYLDSVMKTAKKQAETVQPTRSTAFGSLSHP